MQAAIHLKRLHGRILAIESQGDTQWRAPPYDLSHKPVHIGT